MGMNKYIFIGAYISIPNETKKVVEKVSTCINKNCSKHGVPKTQDFCCDCGHAISLIGIEKEKEIDFRDRLTCYGGELEIEEDAFHYLHGDGEVYLTSNFNDNTTIDAPEYEDDPIRIIDPQFINDAIKSFQQKFSDQIVMIETSYKRKFEVNFGIKAYYM